MDRQFGAHLFGGNLAVVHYLTEDEIREAWTVFRGFSDKEWSFTDCTSRIVLKTWGITRAFVFDHHFLAEWRKFLPSAEVHHFPDAGHYVLEDAGAEILPLIRDFLQRHAVHA